MGNINKDFEVIDINLLKPDAENARLHSETQLKSIAASLTRFGQQKPLVVSSDNYIIAGNGTYEAAKELLGWSKIAIIRSELDDKEARAYGIADNQIPQLSEWDVDSLSKHMSDLATLDDDPNWESLGFMDDVITPLIEDADDSEGGLEKSFNDYLEGKGGAKEDTQIVMAKPIKVTEEQWDVIDQAITIVKMHSGDFKMKPGRAIELICGDYLSGVSLPESEKDIDGTDTKDFPVE